MLKHPRLIVTFLLASLPTAAAAQADLAATKRQLLTTMRTPSPPLPASGGPQLAIAEHEYNDSPAWANDIVPGVDIDGSLDSTTDRDVYRLELTGDTLVSILISPGSGTPVDDPDLEITDAVGRSVTGSYEQSPTNPYPGLSYFLPASTVYLHVLYAQGQTGTYRLSVTTTPSPLPAIVPGTTMTGTLTPTVREPMWRLSLPTESRVQARAIGGTLSLFGQLSLPSGASFAGLFSTRTRPDPGIDTTLPAGDYYLSFTSAIAATGTFTFRVDTTPATITPLPCPGTANGNLVGMESQELFRFTLATQSRVQLDLGSLGLGYAGLELRDAALTTVMFGSGFVPSAGLIDTVLPAGTYYAHVWTLSNYGAYTISATCSPVAALPRLEFGRTAVNIPVRQQPAFELKLGTPNPFDLAVTPLSGTWYAPKCSVLDRNGIVRAAQILYLWQTGDYASQQLPAGDYVVLVGENSGWGPVFGLDARPPLSFTDRVNNRRLLSLGRAGEVVYAFAAAQPLASPIALPAPLRGNLLIDLATYVPLGSQALPTSGLANWPFDFTGFDVVVQSLTLDGSLLRGSASDLVR